MMPAFRAFTRLLLPFLVVAPAGVLARAAEITIEPVAIAETKAVFGRIETRDVVPARARIGGTLAQMSVSEGDIVAAGQSIATVIDDKVVLQLRAAEARIRALASEQANIRAELERAQALLQRGAGTQQRVDQLQTQLDVFRNQIAAADAERAVIVQQGAEGEVIAPVAGRVLRVPVTRGAVTLPGEQIALIAGGGRFLRLALPERHAKGLRTGARVTIADGADLAEGEVAKVFPQIENGRVIADVDLAREDGYFVGERVLVHVPIGQREVLAVPREAVTSRSGLDVLTIATPAGHRQIIVVPGAAIRIGGVDSIEILTGLAAGDRVVVP